MVLPYMDFLLFELCLEKNGLLGLRTGLTQTGLYSHRRLLDASNFGFRKKRNHTICVAKTKACSYCEAYLSVCFRIGKNPVFS